MHRPRPPPLNREGAARGIAIDRGWRPLGYPQRPVSVLQLPVVQSDVVQEGRQPVGLLDPGPVDVQA